MDEGELVNILKELQPLLDVGNTSQIRMYTDALNEHNANLKTQIILKLEHQIITSENQKNDNHNSELYDSLIMQLSYVAAFLNMLFCDESKIKMFITNETIIKAINVVPPSFYKNLSQRILKLIQKNENEINQIPESIRLVNIIPDLKKIKLKIEYTTNINDIKRYFRDICSLFEIMASIYELKNYNEGEIKNLRQTNQSLHLQLEEQQNSISDLQVQITSMKKLINDAALRMDETTNLENSIERLEKENLTLKQSSKSLQLQINELKNKNIQLASMNKELTTQIQELDIQFKNAETSQKYKDELDEVEAKLIETQNELAQSRLTNQDLFNQIQELHQNLCSKTKQLESKLAAESEVKKVNTELELARSKLTTMQLAIDDKSKSIQLMTDRLKELSKVEEQLLAQVDSSAELEEAVEELRTENLRLSEKLNTLRDENSEIPELRSLISKQEGELMKIRSELRKAEQIIKKQDELRERESQRIQNVADATEEALNLRLNDLENKKILLQQRLESEKAFRIAEKEKARDKQLRLKAKVEEAEFIARESQKETSTRDIIIADLKAQLERSKGLPPSNDIENQLRSELQNANNKIRNLKALISNGKGKFTFDDNHIELQKSEFSVEKPAKDSEAEIEEANNLITDLKLELERVKNELIKTKSTSIMSSKIYTEEDLNAIKAEFELKLTKANQLIQRIRTDRSHFRKACLVLQNKVEKLEKINSLATEQTGHGSRKSNERAANDLCPSMATICRLMSEALGVELKSDSSFEESFMFMIRYAKHLSQKK